LKRFLAVEKSPGYWIPTNSGSPFRRQRRRVATCRAPHSILGRIPDLLFADHRSRISCSSSFLVGCRYAAEMDFVFFNERFPSAFTPGSDKGRGRFWGATLDGEDSSTSLPNLRRLPNRGKRSIEHGNDVRGSAAGAHAPCPHFL
jgi:hypothetical protein